MKKRDNALMTFSRVIFTLPAGIFFVFIMPFIIVRLSPKMGTLHRYKVMIGDLNYFAGGIMIIIGLVLALWTIFVQIKRGLGTPMPLLPPEKLLIDGPYKYCRNPMVFGGYIYYFGISCFVGSLSSFFIVALFIIILMIFIKIGEEPELEKRFGQAYKEYKQETPFMIPKINGKRWYFLFLH
jgi:protein-S-isoprenylcysteine O-methyltransferase Ste14